MKIRTDYVTNSSSSAYILTISVDYKKTGTKTEKAAKFSLMSDPEGAGGFADLYANINAKELAEADTIQELIGIIDRSIHYRLYAETCETIKDSLCPISELYKRTDLNDIVDEYQSRVLKIENNKSFFSKLHKHEMSDIYKISIMREKYLHNSGSWVHHQSYDLKTKEFKYDKNDVEPEDEG